MKLSVLQWNVLFSEKADNILDLIREVGADFICLQELTQNSTINPGRDLPAEIAQLGYNSTYILTINHPDLPFGQMGNGLFSKFPIVSKRKIFVRHEAPGGTSPSNENRVYLEAQVDIGSKLLTVGTAHLSFTPGFAGSAEKEAESEKFKAAISKNKSDFVFTGDLNALPSSTLIQDLDKLFQHAGPAYAVPTWTTKPFDYQGFKANKLDWRLDYVYTTPDIKVLSAKTVDTEYSDHLPILVEIEI